MKTISFACVVVLACVAGCAKSQPKTPAEAAGFPAPTQAEKDAAMRNAEQMRESLNKGY